MPTTRELAATERFIPGRVLAGRYRVIELVGQGGMGEVYRAQDLKLGQAVALKFLPPEFGRDPKRLEGLFAEVRLARQVSHPNVCRVHDVEEMDGMHFLSMEFVDGEDLASLLRRIGRLPQDKAIEIVREMCAGLAAIHDRGVMHRDLKPANVMIDGRGHARITDFGLAEFEDVDTESGTIVGTPAYMAPECFVGGQAPTVQRDLYSLGLVMYELFTGRRAFEATTLGEMIRLRRELPVSPSKVQRDVDPAVERLILKCLEPDPERRPSSARAVAAVLPGVDPLTAVIAAGRTPSPELVAASTTDAEGLRPAAAWTCLGGLLVGLLLVTAVSPRTRLVPALPLGDPPESMAEHARLIAREVGLPPAETDRARGYTFDESVIERIVANDRLPSRWNALARARPPVATFWYRESPVDLDPAPPWYRVTWSDPPPVAAGSIGIQLDGLGRLRRLDAPPGAAAGLAATAAPVGALFRAAGLDTSDFLTVDPDAARAGEGDVRLAWVGQDRDDPQPLRVDLVAFRGHPVSFAVQEVGAPAPPADPSGRLTDAVLRFVRPLLILVALFLGAWIARRNVRAGRGDTKRAVFLAGFMMALRVAVWVLGGHHTARTITEQLMTTLAWGLYDFAYGWISYMAIEPYLRRLWPRMLTSWMRLVDGKHADPRVGRDVLIGCLVGTAISLAVAAHQAAPVLFDAPPGRPDNVGYVEQQLASLLGLRHQLAGIFGLMRSNLVLLLGFVMILVVARLVLRNATAAVVAAFLIFVPLAMPQGEFLALNLALAITSMLLLLFVMMRFGLLAAGVALFTHAALQSAPLGMGLGSWPTSRTALVLAIVLGLGAMGFVRALGARPAFRDMLAE